MNLNSKNMLPTNQFCVIQETGEHFFLPDTVENIQKIILGHPKPFRMIHTPVFEFS